jgi:hypothetical protein
VHVPEAPVNKDQSVCVVGIISQRYSMGTAWP